MLAEAITSTRSDVIAALKQASAATGSDFHYLLGTAMRESHLQPEAKAGTSSASGLFQFTEQTWLGVVKQHGAQFGLGSYAAAISRDESGHYHVNDRADRQVVLALRNDPKTAALMAGEFAQETRCQLKGELGRDVCGGELYAAHFLGPRAACRLIRMNESDPGANAAAAFPGAASANRNVFYRADGSAKTVSEVYAWAMKQPMSNSTVQGTMPPTATGGAGAGHHSAMAFNARDEDAQNASFLFAGGLPTSPASWTPGLMQLLASLREGSLTDSNTSRL